MVRAANQSLRIERDIMLRQGEKCILHTFRKDNKRIYATKQQKRNPAVPNEW